MVIGEINPFMLECVEIRSGVFGDGVGTNPSQTTRISSRARGCPDAAKPGAIARTERKRAAIIAAVIPRKLWRRAVVVDSRLDNCRSKYLPAVQERCWESFLYVHKFARERRRKKAGLNSIGHSHAEHAIAVDCQYRARYTLFANRPVG